MNMWRDIPSGDKPPEVLNIVVEVISKSRDKYEYHRDWEAFTLDRVLHSSVVFPVEYGFIPQTWFKDNDPRMDSQSRKVRKTALRMYSFIEKNMISTYKQKPVDPSIILTDEDIEKIIGAVNNSLDKYKFQEVL